MLKFLTRHVVCLDMRQATNNVERMGWMEKSSSTEHASMKYDYEQPPTPVAITSHVNAD